MKTSYVLSLPNDQVIAGKIACSKHPIGVITTKRKLTLWQIARLLGGKARSDYCGSSAIVLDRTLFDERTLVYQRGRLRFSINPSDRELVLFIDQVQVA